MNRRDLGIGMGASLGAALLNASLAKVAKAAGPGRWMTAKPIPVGANEVIGAAVGGKLLVYGGLSSFVAQGLFWAYDPATDSWTELAGHQNNTHHSACVGVGDSFYVFGGFRKPADGQAVWQPTHAAWVFDLPSKTWTQLPPMPTARGALTACQAGDRIYVIGGSDIPPWDKTHAGMTLQWGGEQSAANEVFDIKTGKWSTANPMLQGRNHMKSTLVNGKIYVIGGRVGSAFVGASTSVGINEAYDVAKDSWTPMAMMPTPRGGLEVAMLDNKIHVLGGEAYAFGLQGTSNVHEVYDPAVNSWNIAPNMPSRRHGFAIAEIGGKIYCVTGSDVAGNGGGPATGITANEVFIPE
jgi:N-acetylneuraminic acid mutarotase